MGPLEQSAAHVTAPCFSRENHIRTLPLGHVGLRKLSPQDEMTVSVHGYSAWSDLLFSAANGHPLYSLLPKFQN